MAGVQTIYTAGTNRTPWYICPNGEIIEPLDVIHTVFPNEGRDSAGDNICFIGRPFRSSLLTHILPPPSVHFTPDEFIDGLISILVVGICVTISILFAKELWNCLDSNFRSITPAHKKMYVVANLSKAALLAVLAMSPRYWIGSYNCFILDEFKAIETKRCGIIYIVTDLVALFLVPKLPRSTVFHHVTTTIMSVIICSMNLQVKGWSGLLGVSKMGVLYGLFSSAAFPVNMYLAFRVVYPKAKWLYGFAMFCLFTYVICCALNWSIHGVWLIRILFDWNFSVYTLLYMVAIYFMVTDDIVLMKWLAKRGQNKSSQKVIKAVAATKVIDVADGKDKKMSEKVLEALTRAKLSVLSKEE